MTLRLACVALSCLAAVSTARAEDRWTDPAPGVRHLARVDRYPYDQRPQYVMHALVVDLNHPAVRVVASRPEDAGTVVSAFADRVGADLAWNTNFFGSPQDSCGLMMGEGQKWDRAYDDGCHASIGFGDENQAGLFVQGDPRGNPPDGWMRQIATGKPEPILSGGEPRFRYGCATHCAYNPRTGMGLSQDRRTLYVVVVDGRSDQSVGAGLDDLANLLRDLGAWDAINLDGGGSSALFVRGEGGVVNRPSDGRERVVCCHMGLKIDGNAAWWRAERVGQAPAEDAAAAFAPGEVREFVARFRNAGRKRWRPDGDHPVRLGTQDPQDRDTPWRHDDWPDTHRAAAVEGEVGPGGEGTFRFRLRAPAEAGAWREAFAPVAEGASWMADQPVAWRLAVAAPPDASVAPADAAAPPPDAGGPAADAALDARPDDDSAPAPDARPPSSDAESALATRATATEYDGGCGATPTSAPALASLLLLVWQRRRRRAHPTTGHGHGHTGRGRA